MMEIDWVLVLQAFSPTQIQTQADLWVWGKLGLSGQPKWNPALKKTKT